MSQEMKIIYFLVFCFIKPVALFMGRKYLQWNVILRDIVNRVTFRD